MKCGTVAVVGRANAGKSTLINVLVGEKISRDNVIGILNRQDYQVVFVDTPGVYASTTLLGSGMEKMGESVAKDVDLVLFVLDIHAGVNEKDLELLNRYIKKGYKIILALTKIDIMPKENIMESLVSFSNCTVEEIVPISARKGKNVKELLNCILKHLPQGEKIYSDDVISDKSEKFMVGEIMREKILLKYDKEIPHGIAVVVNEFTQRETGVYYINLDIVCEKANHKAIIIGKGGKKLKEVVSFARADMEKFLGTRVFLETFVKVKEDWRNSKNLLTEFGYKKNI